MSNIAESERCADAIEQGQIRQQPIETCWNELARNLPLAFNAIEQTPEAVSSAFGSTFRNPC